MNKKIFGVTVGTPLPKPNLMQTNPTKGDFVRGREEFKKQIEEVAKAVIPDVSEEDNGKILQVIGGKWSTGVPSWNDLKDKPFGETGEVSMIKILDTNDIIGNENIESSTIGEAPHWVSYEHEDGRTAHYMAFYLPGELLKVGSEYVVNIDGAELTAVCVEDNSSGPGAGIGAEREDAELLYYFYMGICATPDDPTNYYEIGFMGDSEPSQVTIYEKDPEIKKIDPKYLPEGGVGYAETKSRTDVFDIIQIIYDATEQLLGDVFEVIPPEESPTGKLFINGYFEVPKFPFDIVAGNEYMISIDGNAYAGTAVAMERDGTEVVCFGDIEDIMSGNFANFRFVVTQGKFDGGEFLEFAIDAESFYMNSTPATMFIYCLNQEEIIHKIDPKFLPNIDWNENNPEADGYIENRPFYTEIFKTPVFENAIVDSGSGYSDDWYAWNFEDIPAIDIDINKRYRVILAGVEYDCTPYYADYPGEVAIGNAGFYDPTKDTGEPFYIYKISEEDYGIVVHDKYPDYSWQGPLSLYEIIEEVHKIDPKFLPDGMGGGVTESQVIALINEALGVIENGTY